jgi:hypothetical protein
MHKSMGKALFSTFWGHTHGQHFLHIQHIHQADVAHNVSG